MRFDVPGALVCLLAGVVLASFAPSRTAEAQEAQGPRKIAFAVEQGGLISCAVSASDAFRRAAFLVDRLLHGAKPADLPVEQPTEFELAVNLKTAQARGLTVSPSSCWLPTA